MLLAVFAGPRSNADAVISDLKAAGMPAAVDRATRFHVLEKQEPLKVDGGVVLDEEGRPVLAPAAGRLDGDKPVYEKTPGGELVEVLCDDLGAAQDVAGRHGFRLRMHGPSGFSSIEEAEALS